MSLSADNHRHRIAEPVVRWRTSVDVPMTVLCGIVSFGLYLRTLWPSVLISDSAEFQVLAYQLGIAHTPGYPIYLVLAHLFTYLPIGSVAYRVNLFSALMAAMAVAGMYVSARLLTGKSWAAFYGALALAVSFTLWSQAVIAEVYTSGAAFLTWMLAALLAWRTGGKPWTLGVACLLGALSLGVHSTTALFGLPVLLLLLLDRRSGWLRPACIGTAAGLLLYLLAFLLVDLHDSSANIFQAGYGPSRSFWGLSQADIANPFQRIWFIASGRQWQGSMFSNWAGVPGRVLEFAGKLPREFSVLTLLLALVGLVTLFLRDRAFGWFTALSLLMQLSFALTYNIGDYYVFYLASYVLFALLAAYGAGVFCQWLGRKIAPVERFVPLVALVLVLGLGIGPVFSQRWQAVLAGEVPFIGMEASYPANDNAQAIAHMASRVVPALPQDAIVFLSWDPLYTFWYTALIDANRDDLRFIETAPHADQEGLADSLIDFVDAHIDTNPLFFSQPWPELERAGYRFELRDIQFAQFYQLKARTTAP